MSQNYFIAGLIIFIILFIAGNLLTKTAYVKLETKNKFLIISTTGDLNKYSISLLIVTTIIYFLCMKHFKFAYNRMTFIYFIFLFFYSVVFTYSIYKEIKKLNLTVKSLYCYSFSRFIRLFGLGILLLTMFLFFSNYKIF
jgi:hypothetical protein